MSELKILGTITNTSVEKLVAYLSKHKNRLQQDVSSYAPGRNRYWLQFEWDLRNKTFTSGHEDPVLWKYCKQWMPDADLGLVVHGPVGIKPHRDDSYADWRGVGINLGKIGSWSYDCQYPYYWGDGPEGERWSDYMMKCNAPNPQNHDIPVGGVFEFNTKNLHGVNDPAEDRWAIFLWKVSKKFRTNFNRIRGEE
jgi:hypothetical protein